MERVVWKGNKKPSLMSVLKMFRQNGTPPKSLANFQEGKNIETLSLQQLKKSLESLDFNLVDACQILGVEVSRENLVNLSAAAIIVANEENEDTESENKSKKRKLDTDNEKESDALNREEFKRRIIQLDELIGCKKYNVQKDKLEVELNLFLANMCPPQTIDSVSVYTMREFLVYKDKGCKTRIHEKECSRKGSSSTGECSCPLRRAASSLDSLIGQLRAIFRDRGRGSVWNEQLAIGNPMASLFIKRHLEATKIEQNLAMVTSKQAKPLFLEKILKLSRYIRYNLANPELNIKNRYLLERDDAFFRFIGFSGDRAGDLARLKTEQVKYLPEKDGILVRMMEGKVIKGTPRVFVLLRSDTVEVCPVAAIEEYLEFCDRNGYNIRSGYLFRSCRSMSDFHLNKPISSSAMNSRLKKHLQNAGLLEGETAHGARGACAMTLKLLGVSDENICRHVGWNSPKMLSKYTSVLSLVSNKSSALSIARDGVEVETKQMSAMSADMRAWADLDGI